MNPGLPIDQLLSTTFDKQAVVQRLKENPEEVDIAMTLMHGTEQPQAWRAAWALKEVLANNDPRLLAKLDDLLQVLGNRPDGHQRELLHLIERCELNDEQEGSLFETCLYIWAQPSKSPSVRYTAIKHLIGIINKYPELKNELSPYLENEYLEGLTPGVRRGVDKLIASLPA